MNESKLLSFPFIYFSESGLFNELQPEKNKKSAVALISRLGCGSDVSNSQLSSLFALIPPDRIRLLTIRITAISCFGKKIQALLALAVERPVTAGPRRFCRLGGLVPP